MKKVAIIDLGTNTFNILIVEIDNYKNYSKLYQTKRAVKLGEGGINSGIISPVPFQRGLKVLNEYKNICNNLDVKTIVAFATSAIRSASNGTNFIKQTKEQTGIEIQLISGDKEAELIYYGVREAVKMNEQTSLIMDIGGGSTEFIIASKDTIIWKNSFLLGAARLFEKFNPSDPITDKEIEAIIIYIKNELISLSDAIEKFPVTELIGSSGSFDSLAEMIVLQFYSLEKLMNKTEYTFDLSDCYTIYKQVIKSTHAERMQMKGLVEMRVDMFVISSILVHYILTNFGIKKMRLSTYSLKEGVLVEMLNKM